MKLTVITYGTEGDARPPAALCRALMGAGHTVHMLGDRSTLGTARALGVPASALSGDIRGTLDPGGSIAGVIEKGNSFSEGAKALASIANQNTQAWMREILEAGVGSDALLVSGLAVFAGLSAAEKLGVPVVALGMIPLHPTRDFASPFLPPKIVPAFLNRASHHFVNAMLWRAFRKATNAARVEVAGLPPRKENWTEHAMLYGISPTLMPKPAEWPENVWVCGQWVRPAREWTPPPSLADFLSAGEAPLYVGFGSMVGFDRKQMLEAIVTGVAGRRALFYPGWSGMEAANLPSNFFALGDTPHDWLFPQTSLVIHHGGSGTTHSAARAGAPAVVLPFTGDQPFWARRLEKLGVASGALNGAKLNAADLGRAIEFAELADTRARAKEIGARMAKEDGLAEALRRIEQLLAR